jgi:glycosyltransferase involved in cell wall biosynthesis
VVSDDELAERLRGAGLARAARFSWDRTARQTLEVYKSVL